MTAVGLKVRRLVVLLALALLMLVMTATPAMAQNINTHVNVSGNKICVCNNTITAGDITATVTL